MQPLLDKALKAVSNYLQQVEVHAANRETAGIDILPALKDGDSYGAARCSAGRFGGFLLHRVA
jgi:hypothetical protein